MTLIRCLKCGEGLLIDATYTIGLARVFCRVCAHTSVITLPMANSQNRMRCRAFILAVVLACSPQAAAQGLSLPTAVFASAVSTDLATTYYTTTRMGLTERNPLINRLQHEPALMVAVAGAGTAAGVYAWHRYVGKKHPKWAAAGLYIAAGIETFYAVRNAKRGLANVRGRQ